MGKSGLGTISFICLFAAWSAFAGSGDWSHWRGPDRNGNAVGDAPLEWSDSENVKWKVEIPGRGNSSPVILGDRIFLTTAIQTGESPPPPTETEGRRRFGGAEGPQPEHKFVVMALDRNTGKVLWERTAITAKPHEGYHRQYGNNHQYLSNSIVVHPTHSFLELKYQLKHRSEGCPTVLLEFAGPHDGVACSSNRSVEH